MPTWLDAASTRMYYENRDIDHPEDNPLPVMSNGKELLLWGLPSSYLDRQWQCT